MSKHGRVANVRILRSAQCEGCPGCIDLGKRQERTLEADNTMGAGVGAAVECEIAPRQVLGHSFLVFLFPLVSMMLGYMLFTRLFRPAGQTAEGPGILGAFAGLLMAYLLIRIIDRRWGRSHPVIARIVAYAPAGTDAGAPFTCPSPASNKRIT